MKIEKDTVVTLRYKVADAQGKLIEEAKEPMAYLHGGYGNVFDAVEAALEGKSVGDSVEVMMEPEDGFGEYDEHLVRVEEAEPGRMPGLDEPDVRRRLESDVARERARRTLADAMVTLRQKYGVQS